MKFKKYHINDNSFWRPDYDAILLINQASSLRLNQKAGVIFYNYIVKKNYNPTFYVDNDIRESEIENLLLLLESENFISPKIMGKENLQPIPHISL